MMCGRIAIIVVLGIVLASVVQAVEDPILVTPNGGWRGDVSPDGAWLVYDASGHVERMALPDGEPEVLIALGVDAEFSPDGDLVAYRAGGLRIFDLTTHDDWLLHDGTGWDDGKAWSPLGDEFAVEGTVKLISYPDGVLTTLPCVDQNGSGCDGEGPTWSPDGEWIAFEDGLEILKVPRGGGQAEVVVADLRDVTQPSWSPDGDWIAFGMESEDYSAMHIWVADARGTAFGLVQVTDGDAYDSDATWSPDSQWIYFTSTRGGTSRIWRVHFTGSTPVESLPLGSMKALFLR